MMRRGVEAAVVAVGRLLGPTLVAVAGAKLCADASSWGWFALGLVGAAITVARAAAPSSISIEHTHFHSGRINVDPVRVEFPESTTDDGRAESQVPVPVLAVVPSEPSEPRALANVADLVSALVNLGFKKGLASELAREAISRAPNAPLEELIRVALAKRGER